MAICGTSAARRSPLSSGPSWASRRPSSRSSMSTAASCSRCSSAATRRARYATTSCNAFTRWPKWSRRLVRPSDPYCQPRDTIMQRKMLNVMIRWCGAAGVAISPGAALAATDAALLPRNLSPWNMFVNADIVVKSVMVGLAFASLVTWTVWLAKTIELRRETRRARRRLRMIEQGGSLRDAVRACGSDTDAVAQLILSTARESDLSGGAYDEEFKERVALRLERVEAAMQRQISRGIGVLASIGSTAPFVGLFGTVWGIINSFIHISEANTTSLAVVA